MDYAQRVRARLTHIFAKRAELQTKHNFGESASELDHASVQLLLLLTQKVNYLTCKRLEEVKGIYDLHDDVPYEKLRTEAGRQTIDDLLVQLTSDLDGIVLELSPDFDVCFTAMHPTEPSRILKARDILIGMDDTLAQYIRNGGEGEKLTPKCLILKTGR